jgi:hypothetical protein
MVEIRLFGKLRHFIKEPAAGHDNLMKVAPQPEETLEQLLGRVSELRKLSTLRLTQWAGLR